MTTQRSRNARSAHVRLLLGTLFALGVAALVGLGATWLALTQGQAFGGLTRRRLDRVAAARHRRHRSLCARHGRPHRRAAGRLRRRRRVPGAHRRRRAMRSTAAATSSLTGITPQARYWTITLYDPEGALVAQLGAAPRLHQPGDHAPRQRHVRDHRSARARGRATGCRPAAIERYVLVLRLYDTPIGVATRGREVTMPSVARRACP